MAALDARKAASSAWQKAGISLVDGKLVRENDRQKPVGRVRIGGADSSEGGGGGALKIHPGAGLPAFSGMGFARTGLPSAFGPEKGDSIKEKPAAPAGKAMVKRQSIITPEATPKRGGLGEDPARQAGSRLADSIRTQLRRDLGPTWKSEEWEAIIGQVEGMIEVETKVAAKDEAGASEQVGSECTHALAVGCQLPRLRSCAIPHSHQHRRHRHRLITVHQHPASTARGSISTRPHCRCAARRRRGGLAAAVRL